jgi:hypothetical protein
MSGVHLNGPTGSSPRACSSTEPRAAKGVTSVPPAAVEFGVKKNNHLVEGPDGLAYTARLPLPKIGSRWRALPRRHRAGGTAL